MNFEDLQTKAILFRDQRDWKQFHNPKDLAISIALEAAELLECFQWSGKDLIVSKNNKNAADELADIFNYCILMANALNVDLLEITNNKIDKNSLKYPIELSKGSSAKYTELNNDYL